MTANRSTIAICLFCSSTRNAAESWRGLARGLGEAIARRGHTLVYGGTTVGLMGEAARAAREAGGRVVGVVPALMLEAGIANEECDELVVAPDMRARKAAMDDRSDAFLCLPGGIGTLEEFFEVLTLNQLGVRPRPIGLVDPDGAFDALEALLADLLRRGLARDNLPALYRRFDAVDAAIDFAESPVDHRPLQKWD